MENLDLDFTLPKIIISYDKNTINIDAIRFKILNDKIYNKLDSFMKLYKSKLRCKEGYITLDLAYRSRGSNLLPFRICASKFKNYESKDKWVDSLYIIRTSPMFFAGDNQNTEHMFRSKLYSLLYGTAFNYHYNSLCDNNFISIYKPSELSINEIIDSIQQKSMKFMNAFPLLIENSYYKEAHIQIVQSTGFARAMYRVKNSNAYAPLYDYINPVMIDAFKDVKNVVMRSVLSMYLLLYQKMLMSFTWEPYKASASESIRKRFPDYNWDYI